MKDELKEFLDKVDEKMSKIQGDATEAQKQAAAEAKRQNDELAAKVAQLNEDMKSKDLTIGEMQQKVLDLVAAQGKLNPGAGEQDNFKNIGGIFHKMIGDNLDGIAKTFVNKGFAAEFKADMTTPTHHTGPVYTNQFERPPLLFPTFRHMRSIINVVPTDSLSVDYPREKFPDGLGSFGPQTTEGEDKAEQEIYTEMIPLTLDFEAGHATVTRQMLTNVPWLQNYLTRKLTERFYRREDQKVLALLTSLATAATTTATVAAEALIDMIAQVDQNGYAANGILTTPAKWAEILKTKGSDYSVPGGVSISPNGDILIAGLQLFKHQGVANGGMFVGDWTSLYIVQGGAFSIRTSEHHKDNFTKNKVTFLAEAPIGVAFEAPQAIVKK